MTFDRPLTVRLRNGVTITQSDFRIVLTDDAYSRRVVAQLLPASKPFVLWQGNDYEAIGDYTQAEAENRTRELLGADPASMLSVPPPVPPS